ncbi:hypothetical protein EFS38_07135 [Dickeya undicola]|uniref:Uncharacterized protein n=1 Tax=Dickeya undicola TaxID=1577887 RepID=A0ABX9WWV1_9GAMM|nr:hypothetical protein EFS38_07135 [Dickeya undicola]
MEMTYRMDGGIQWILRPVVVLIPGMVRIRFAQMCGYDYSDNCSKSLGFLDNLTLFISIMEINSWSG